MNFNNTLLVSFWITLLIFSTHVTYTCIVNESNTSDSKS